MSGFELNKIIGAVLGTLLFFMGIGFIAEAIYAPIEAGSSGYALPEPSETAEAETVTEEPAATPLPVLLANASADKGAAVAKKCAACHDFTDGGPNKVGPNLYNLVGREIASHEGFGYSDALTELQGKVGTWTYDELDAFLTSPKDYAPGTKMAFGGIKSETERADLLAYLQGLSASPVPFPAAEAEASQ